MTKEEEEKEKKRRRRRKKEEEEEEEEEKEEEEEEQKKKKKKKKTKTKKVGPKQSCTQKSHQYSGLQNSGWQTKKKTAIYILLISTENTWLIHNQQIRQKEKKM